jgi:tetratricopeptide (TPR) repeat protein
VLTASRALDPLDPWARHLSGQTWAGDTQMRLDLAFDLARAGQWASALEILAQTAPEPHSGTAPLVGYTRAWLLERNGDPQAAKAARTAAAKASPDYCFPARLEEIGVLEAAIAANPQDARAPFYLGHLLYDRRRHREAIALWETAVRLEPTNATAWRCLGIGYANILKRPAKARAAYEQAITAMPDDARLLFELDQLQKRQGDSPRKRLRALEDRSELVARRDDLTVEICALYNQTGQPEKAQALLAARHFQPWEGGEGQAHGQHVRTQLLLGRVALAHHDFPCALNHFKKALSSPRNLSEARHLLANQSDIHFWLGEARAAAGDRAGARDAWIAAATFKGDFQDMSVRAFSELTYFSALAWGKLGQKAKAQKLLRDLLAYAVKLQKTEAKIDYFATSLPTMLLFDDDLQFRHETTALFLQAQAQLGLGHPNRARKLLVAVLKRDPNHAPAQDLVSLEADAV